jgi:hypothetical protein
MSGTNERDELSQPRERRFNKLAAGAAVTAIAGAGIMLFALNPTQGNAAPLAAKQPKVWVCKYVGKPGVDERLKAGKQPISVNANSIGEDPVVVGSFFNDAQGRSFVLAFNTGQHFTRSDCPAVTNSSPPPSSTAASTSSSASISASESTSVAPPPVVTTTVTAAVAPTQAAPVPGGVAAGQHTPVSGDTAALGGALMALGLGGLATAMRPWKRGAH